MKSCVPKIVNLTTNGLNVSQTSDLLYPLSVNTIGDWHVEGMMCIMLAPYDKYCYLHLKVISLMYENKIIKNIINNKTSWLDEMISCCYAVFNIP